MFQRIEKLRKNAFASMCVFGEDNKNTIAGVWFWKGQELVFPVSQYSRFHKCVIQKWCNLQFNFRSAESKCRSKLTDLKHIFFFF